MLTRCISRRICAPIELEPSRRGGQLTWFGGAAVRASLTARRSGSGRLGLERRAETGDGEPNANGSGPAISNGKQIKITSQRPSTNV